MIGLGFNKITKDILGYMSWYFQLSNNVKDLRASPKSTSFKVKPFLSNKVTNIPTRYSLPIFLAIQLCSTYFRKECSLVWCQGGQYFSHADTQQLGSGKSSTKSKQETLSDVFARKLQTFQNLSNKAGYIPLSQVLSDGKV